MRSGARHSPAAGVPRKAEARVIRAEDNAEAGRNSAVFVAEHFILANEYLNIRCCDSVVHKANFEMFATYGTRVFDQSK